MRDDFLRIAGCIILGLVIIIGALAAIQVLSISPLWTEQGAAWVQAVGSIAALGVAIFVMGRQNEHSARLIADADRKAILRRCDAVSAVVERAHETIDICAKLTYIAVASGQAVAFTNTAKVNINALTEMRTALSAIPAHDLGSYDMVVGLNQTIDAIAKFIHQCELYIEDNRCPPPLELFPYFHYFNRYVGQAKQQFTAGLDALRDH